MWLKLLLLEKVFFSNKLSAARDIKIKEDSDIIFPMCTGSMKGNIIEKKLITKLKRKVFACISKNWLAISFLKPSLIKLEASKKINSKLTG